MTPVPFLEQTITDRHGTYIERWMTPPPGQGVMYEVTAEAWIHVDRESVSSDGLWFDKVRVVHEWRPIEPVPDGWYEQLAAECVEVDSNEHGIPISVHHGATCGQRYTVCPPSPNEGPDCATPECAAYDPSRDATYLFAPDDPDLIEL